VLRDLGAPISPALPPPPLPPNTPPPGVVIVDAAFWNAAMVAPHATREPWGTGVPTEADLVDYALKLEEGDIGQAKCTLTRTAHKVDVVVHHRGGFAVGGSTVHVTLLKWVDPAPTNAAAWDNVNSWGAANTPPVDAFNDVLNSADGKTNTALGAGWSFVLGGAGEAHRVTLTGQTINNTSPGIATFDLDLGGATNDSLMILLAVIREGAPQSTLAAASLKNLAFDNATVAIRSVHVLD